MPQYSDEGLFWTLVRLPSNQVVAAKVKLALRGWTRAVGLLKYAAMPEAVLVFPRCNSIHTVGMRFPIDVVYVNQSWQVVALEEHLRPGKLLWPVAGAWGVIEMRAGAVSEAHLACGDQLGLLPAASTTRP